MGLISRVSSRTYRKKTVEYQRMSRSRSRSPPRGGDRGGSRFGEGGRPPHSDDLHSVQLDGLPDNVSKDDLREDFGKFGKVGDVFLPIDRYTGKTRGFGFIRFFEKRDMEDCLDEFKRDPYEYDGKKIEVQFAKPRPRPGRRGWDPDRRGGGGGGYGRGRGYGGGRDRSPPRGRRSPDYDRRDSRRSPPRREERRDRYRSRSRSPRGRY